MKFSWLRWPNGPVITRTIVVVSLSLPSFWIAAGSTHAQTDDPWITDISERLADLGGQVPRPFYRPITGNYRERRVPAARGSERRLVVDADDGLVVDEPEREVFAELPVVNDMCLGALLKTAQVLRAQHPERKESACIIPDPVELQATLGNLPVRFVDRLTLDCDFATAMTTFIAETGQLLAVKHMGEPLSKLHSGRGYVCRRRNNAPTGKLSEHAFGNGMDLVSFEFVSGRRLDIRAADEMQDDEAAFFTAFRQASCDVFTTVLGPGSNDAHATHLHLDLGRAKGNPNPYRICE